MIQFYKPNPKVTGSACSFWLNRDGSIMASFIKQDSWNDAKKIGSFSKNKDNPKARVIIKLNRIEVAGMIDAIESNREFSVYHNSEKQTLQIKFCAYLDKTTQAQKGFSFSVNKQDKEDTTSKLGFIIGFTFPEARLLKHDLEIFLHETVVISSSEKRNEPSSELREERVPDDREERASLPPPPQSRPSQPKPTAQNSEEDLW